MLDALIDRRESMGEEAGHLAVALEDGAGELGPGGFVRIGGDGATDEAEAQVDGLVEFGGGGRRGGGGGHIGP